MGSLVQEPLPSRATTGGWQKRSLSASHSMERTMGVFLLFQLVTVITPLLAQEYQCDPTPNGLSDNCIGCICEASTRCNVTTKCIRGGRFADLFCSQSRSGLTEARAFSRETPLVIQELGGDVPLTLFALQTLFALTLTDLERTVMAMPWLRVKIIQ